MKKLSILMILILLITCIYPSAMAAKAAGTYAQENQRPTFRGAPEKAETPTATPEPTREPVDYGDPLLNIAMEMVYGVHELAGDENYHSLMRGDAALTFLPGIAATDCTDLRSAQRIEISSSFIMIAASMLDGSLSPTGKAASEASIPSMFISMWNGAQGSTALAEHTVCKWDRTFLAPENFSNCAMLLDCGGTLYWVAFAETGDGIITVTAAPLFMQDGSTAEDIFDFANESIPLLHSEQIYP